MKTNHEIAGEKKFVVDCMLGTLARWLRLLGFDTLYFQNADDEFLVNLARAENRILITRDKGILYPNSIVLDLEPLTNQIARIMNLLGVNKVVLNPLLSRCPHCNSKIKAVSPTSVVDIVPEKVASNFDEFFACSNPSCKQVYWKGSHWKNMLVRISEINSLLQKDEIE